MLDGKPTSCIVAWSSWYTETGWRNDFWPYPVYNGPIVAFNWTQSSAVFGLLIRHDTLRRHL